MRFPVPNKVASCAALVSLVFAAPALAQDVDVSGKLTFGHSWNNENTASLLAGQYPEQLSQLGFALGFSASNVFGGRFFAEFAGYGQNASDGRFTEALDLNVNEAYYSFDINDFTVIAGRKRTRWGVGLVSSPTEIISAAASPLSPNDDFYQIHGRDLLQVTYTGVNNSVDFLLLGEEPDARQLERSALAFRYYTNLNGVDLSFVGGVEENGEYVVGANVAFTVGQALELHADVLYDSDAPSRQLTFSGLGVPQFTRSSAVSALIGGQWTSQSDINVILEYLYFQDGLSNNQLSGLINTNALAVLAAGARSPELLQTHYLFGRVAKDDVLEGIDLEYSALASLENVGALHTLRLTKDLGETFRVFGEISATTGGALTEFGQYPANTSLRFGVTAEF